MSKTERSHWLLRLIKKRIENICNCDITWENANIQLGKIEFFELSLHRKSRLLFSIQQLVILPRWHFPPYVDLQFEFDSLVLPNQLLLSHGNGMALNKKKTFLLEGKMFFEQNSFDVRLEMFTPEKEDNRTIQLQLESNDGTIFFPLGDDFSLQFHAPNQVHFDLRMPTATEGDFKEEFWRNVSWQGSWSSASIHYPFLEFPNTTMKTTKQVNTPSTFELFSPEAEGLHGKGKIDYDQQRFVIQGQLQSQQPLLQRVFSRFETAPLVKDQTQIRSSIHLQGRNWQEISHSFKMRGNMVCNPIEIEDCQCESFKGKFYASLQRFKVKAENVHLNQGVVNFDYLWLSAKKIESRIELDHVDISPFVKYWRSNLQLSGHCSGKLNYVSMFKKQKTYWESDLSIAKGEMIHSEDFWALFVPWKELQEVRKQLFHWEGFQICNISFHLEEGCYSEISVRVIGKVQQEIWVTGTYSKEAMNLLLEACFAQVASLVFSIKGSYQSPIILPVPTKMASRLIENSQKAIKEILGNLKEIV